MGHTLAVVGERFTDRHRHHGGESCEDEFDLHSVVAVWLVVGRGFGLVESLVLYSRVNVFRVRFSDEVWFKL